MNESVSSHSLRPSGSASFFETVKSGAAKRTDKLSGKVAGHLQRIKAAALQRGASLAGGQFTKAKKSGEKDARYQADKLVTKLVKQHGVAALQRTIAAMEEELASGQVTKDGRFSHADLNVISMAFESVKSDQAVKTAGAAGRQLLKAQTGEDEAVPKQDKAIRDHLVALVHRPDVQLEIIGNEGRPLAFRQSQGHVEEGAFKTGALSAELQKSERGVHVVANQGYYTMADGAGHPEVIGSRSARSDEPDKILDKSRGDILARLQLSAGGDRVLRRQADGSFTYRRADITLMDVSLVKSIGTQAQSLVKMAKSGLKGKIGPPIEDERAFVKQKKQAVDVTYGAGQSLTHELAGQTIHERKPVVLNYVFSGQAKKLGNVEEARKSNIPARLAMLQDYMELHPESAIAKGLKGVDLSSPKQVAQRLYELQGLQGAEATIRRGLLFGLTGRTPDGAALSAAERSAMEILYDMPLIDAAGIAFSSECKSGNDRTATSVALRVAQKAYTAKYGAPYEYAPGKNESEEFGFFKAAFTQAFIEFGGSNVLYSRGQGANGKADIKVGSSPVYDLFANHEQVNAKLNVV